MVSGFAQIYIEIRPKDKNNSTFYILNSTFLKLLTIHEEKGVDMGLTMV